MTPRVLLVGGLDPSGGAGLAADLEALAWFGARGFPVAAALTAQGPRGALGAEPVSPRLLRAQVTALFDGARDGSVGAVKVGMLGTAANARELARLLSRAPLAGVPVVVDPVLAASSGRRLFDREGEDVLPAYRALFARAALVTPNWPELEELARGGAVAARAVLLKGGHRAGPAEDLLFTERGVAAFTGRRLARRARGTGCRLASAIAAQLARGVKLETAVRAAKLRVARYLAEEGLPL